MPIPSRRSRTARRSPGQLRPRTAPAADLLESRRLLSGTLTVNAAGGADYTDLETAIVAAPSGSTLLVSPGTYTAHATTIDPNQSVFWINKPLTIRSTGGAAVTTLAVPLGQLQNLLISSGDVRVEGFSLKNGRFGIQAQDFAHGNALDNVTLADLTLTPDTTTGQDGQGILFENVDHSVIDGCAVGLSYVNGIYLDSGSDDDLVANSSVAGTVTQHAIAVRNSSGDRVLNDTVTGSAFDGVILVGATDCRVTGNSISGHRVDGICLTGDSDDNYIALNTVVSDGHAAGRTDGTGVWLNDDSDGNTVFANTISGAPECGIDVFNSSDNLLQGNDVFDNFEGGILVYSLPNNATYPGGVPTDTVIVDNDLHANAANVGVILRGAVDADVERNVVTGTYTGTLASGTDGGLLSQASTDVRFVGNTLLGLQFGLDLDAASTGVQVDRNREVGVAENYAYTGTAATFDASYTLGGNFWGTAGSAAGPLAIPVGDPSVGTPYAAFLNDAAGNRGGHVDQFPFADESLGLSTAVAVTAPAADTTVAAGSRRAIQWSSPGSTLVDLYYSSSATGDVPIATDHPNNGVYAWTVPAGLPAGTDYTIKVYPENAAGQRLAAAGVGGTFAVSGSAAVVLLSPGPGQTAAPGGTLQVAWSTATAGTPVDVQLQVDGGGWTTLATAVTDEWATVTLPNVTTAAARVRVVNRQTGLRDTQDGTFRIGTTPALVGLPAAVQIGTDQPLAWTSPAGSATVTAQYWDGNVWQPIVTALPDDGQFTWSVPERFTNASSIRLTYYNSAGTQVGTVASGPFNIDYSSAVGSAVAVYRLYLAATQEHLYTTDANENAVLGKRRWTQEGSPYRVYNGSVTVDGVAAVPEYRLYNPSTLQHLWTTDRNEYFTLRATPSWQPEGVAAYLLPTAVPSSSPLYRLAFPGSPLLHLWTTDENEYGTLATRGWKQEGVVGQVFLT